MSFREITMQDVRELLRRRRAGQRARRITRETGLDRKTAGRYLDQAVEDGVTAEAAVTDEIAGDRRLFAKTRFMLTSGTEVEIMIATVIGLVALGVLATPAIGYAQSGPPGPPPAEGRGDAAKMHVACAADADRFCKTPRLDMGTSADASRLMRLTSLTVARLRPRSTRAPSPARMIQSSLDRSRLATKIR